MSTQPPGWNLLASAGRAACGFPSRLPEGSDLEWTQDPARLLALAERHRMTPLLASAAPNLPAMESLRRRAMGLAVHTSRRVEELLEIARVFRRQGIRWFTFKGPALAQAVFGDATLRPLDDLDLLVHPRDMRAACRVITELGYLEQSRSGGEFDERLRGNWGLDFRRTADGGLLEIKHDVLPHYFGMKLASHIPWDSPDGVTVDGESLPLLPAPLQLLALCGHGAWHRWERLLWLCDVSALIHRNPTAFETAMAVAREEGWMGLLSLGLDTARRALELADLPSVPALADDENLSWARSKAMEVLWEMPSIKCSARELREFHLRTRERWIDRAMYRVRLVTGSGDGDWRWLRLPAGLGSVYRLLRPLRLAVRRSGGHPEP